MWYRTDRVDARLRAITALVVAALMAVGGISTAAAEEGDELKIGYVDLHRALEESERGQEITEELRQEFEQRQQQLDEEQQEVLERQQEMEQQAPMMSEEARQQEGMELQQEMQQLQETYLELQNELAQLEAEATQELFEDMQSVARQIGEERGFSMIIEQTETSVLYAVDGLDLTDEVIERIDAQHGGGGD